MCGRKKMTDKEIKSKIKNAFRNYESNKAIAAEWLCSLPSAGLVANYSGIKVSSSGQNGIERQVIENSQKEYTAYSWCKVVENTLIRFKGEHKDKLIELFFFRRLGANLTAKRLHISKRTLFYWLDEILFVAEMWARDYKLIW